ncbi:uncharacterized protein CANTADRAFT_25001 [Suhomyces tanzawaensis NRRL Y-17324]|uniref:C2H2-type domain-containing protein n=1 Tax=Suhomyces tanzawaensis NRRL Y-17324 TaxID=984487 RepID=A0A1E4SLS1_9ASCO|nr:uncharacterized protein CANTADRAFT_25001 [Suhomyces tanzawaensis NRRL Y-17324]ODV80460.1 hypothetical protein CANTADRAFT_25001 [Suhomyces tanzawaensis NRRL Y-17324]
MKLTPHRPFILLERPTEHTESINAYSARLLEILYLLTEEKGLDDNSRISIESMLFETTSYIPTPLESWTFSYQQSLKRRKLNSFLPKEHPVYPNEALSKILIDNYSQLHRFASSYFNLSLSSHITKYLVELIYSLQCWELYHLINIIPDIEYFLKLIGFEVTPTSFGPIIKPPANYLNDDMLSGLQYPFPYPFYNYSYHSFNSKSEDRKFDGIKINPYTGVDLPHQALATGKHRRRSEIGSRRKSESRVKQESGRNPYLTRSRANSLHRINDPTESDISPSGSEEYDEDDENEEDEEEEDEEDGDLDEYEIAEQPLSTRSRKDSIEARGTEDTRFPMLESNQGSGYSVQNNKPSDVSSSEDDNDKLLADAKDKEQDMGSKARDGPDDPTSPLVQFPSQLKFIQQSPRKTKGLEAQELLLEAQDDKNKKNKSSVIHQCQLTDPTTLRRCLKIFYGKNELLRHQEFVHATKKKIYKCIYCSRNNSKIQSYPRHDSLARHIRRKHGVTGKENKMAVNYAKENVEVIDDPNALVTKQHHFGKPLPHPQYLNLDFTIKPGYAGFLLFSSKDTKPPSPTAKNRVVDVISQPLADSGALQDAQGDEESPTGSAGFQSFRVGGGHDGSNSNQLVAGESVDTLPADANQPVTIAPEPEATPKSQQPPVPEPSPRAP